MQSYARELERVTGRKLELVSLETEQGADKAKLYDISNYPAVIAVRDDGELVQLWQSELLPTINEVSGYFS